MSDKKKQQISLEGLQLLVNAGSTEQSTLKIIGNQLMILSNQATILDALSSVDLPLRIREQLHKSKDTTNSYVKDRYKEFQKAVETFEAMKA